MVAMNRCPVCGSSDVAKEIPEAYRYTEAGLSGVTLIGRGVSVTRCRECRIVTTVVQDEQQLLQAIGLSLVLGPPGMTGEELRFLRSMYGMTQAELAAALGLPRRETVADWERKDRIFKRVVDEVFLRLILLSRFRDEVIDSDHCFLVEDQVRAYRDHARSFVERAEDLLHDNRQPAPLRIRHRPRKKIWFSDSVVV